jgi:ribonuclease HI
MTYKYSRELENKANEFIKYLSEKGFDAEIVENSYRDYSVKIFIAKENFSVGNATVYFSPTKNKYTIVLIEIMAGFREEIEKLWYEMNFDFKPPVYKNKGIEIDVDGAFRKDVTSYAAIIRKDGIVIEKLSGILDESEVLGSHQVAGELAGVVEALKWCRKNNINKVTIFYDMKGIEMWATGKWKTKKDITRSYTDFFKDNKIKIDWVKIESHTGVKWNEEADKLAKKTITEYHRTVKRRK